MRKLSAVVIARDEEEKIERALKSLRPVSDEIVVVDSGSTDATPGICRRHADRFIEQSWMGYRDQKRFATGQATHDWVLSLDADEELSPDLQTEIASWKKKSDSSENGYQIPRLTFFMGRWIRHTTWYPDWQLRLFRKSAGRWEGGRVHESFRISGPSGRMTRHIYHYTYSSPSEYLQQLDSFSALAARDSFDRGQRCRWYHLGLMPTAIFLKNFLLRLGFLDGVPGLAVSALSATSTLFKYLKLRELGLHPPHEHGR